MDRTQAAEIEKHMRKAANAIDRASQIISALDADDREMLAAPLEKIVPRAFRTFAGSLSPLPDLRRLQPVDPLRIRSAVEEVVLPENRLRD